MRGCVVLRRCGEGCGDGVMRGCGKGMERMCRIERVDPSIYSSHSK